MRHVHELSEPILDEAGRLVRTIGTNQDVTERQHAGEALRESEARLKQAQDIARIGSFLWDEVKDEAIYRSDVIHDIYCLSPEETPHAFEDLLSLYHPDDRGRIGESYTAAAAAGEPYDIEYRVIRPDGEIRHVHELSHREYDEDGNHVRSAGTLQDITELKRAGEALRVSEALLRHGARIADLGYWIWDEVADSNIYFSAVFARLHGMSVEACLETLTSHAETLERVHSEDRE